MELGNSSYAVACKHTVYANIIMIKLFFGACILILSYSYTYQISVFPTFSAQVTSVQSQASILSHALVFVTVSTTQHGGRRLVNNYINYLI